LHIFDTSGLTRALARLCWRPVRSLQEGNPLLGDLTCSRVSAWFSTNLTTNCREFFSQQVDKSDLLGTHQGEVLLGGSFGILNLDAKQNTLPGDLTGDYFSRHLNFPVLGLFLNWNNPVNTTGGVGDLSEEGC